MVTLKLQCLFFNKKHIDKNCAKCKKIFSSECNEITVKLVETRNGFETTQVKLRSWLNGR